MTGTGPFIAVVAVFIAALILARIANRHGGRKVTGRRATLSELLEPVRSQPVTHQTPDYDAVPQVTPCCSVPVPLLPPGEPVSHEPQKVTCRGGES